MIVLDTHAWIWWVGETGDLSPRAAEAIAGAERVGVCAISCWEVAMLVARKRLALEPGVERWVRSALARPEVAALDLTPAAALRAGGLEGANFPGDPADRFIYATAVDRGVPLRHQGRRHRGLRPVPSDLVAQPAAATRRISSAAAWGPT